MHASVQSVSLLPLWYCPHIAARPFGRLLGTVATGKTGEGKEKEATARGTRVFLHAPEAYL